LTSPDSGGRSTIVQYIWNFGDSAQVQTTQDRIVEHRYARPANITVAVTRAYSVVLTVIDSAGRRASIARDVTVTGPAIIVAGRVASARLAPSN